MTKHYPEENYGLWGRALTNPTPESEEKRRAENQVKAWNAIWPRTPDDTDLHDLKGRVGYYQENRPEDVAKVQLATHKASHTDLNISGGPTGIFGSPDHDGLIDLQRERGLKPDGKVFPDGETISNLKQNPLPKREFLNQDDGLGNFTPIGNETPNQREFQNLQQAAPLNTSPYSEPHNANKTGEKEQADATAAGGDDITNYADGSDPNAHNEERDVNVVDGRRVYPPEKIKRALSKLFGEDIDDTEVWEDTLFGKLHIGTRATTRKNRIYTNLSKEEFFSDSELLLHEYFHVMRQWNPGKLTRLGYLVESFKNGYTKNEFEVEARRFAKENIAKFQALLKEQE